MKKVPNAKIKQNKAVFGWFKGAEEYVFGLSATINVLLIPDPLKQRRKY